MPRHDPFRFTTLGTAADGCRYFLEHATGDVFRADERRPTLLRLAYSASAWRQGAKDTLYPPRSHA